MMHVFRVLVGGGFLLTFAAVAWAVVTYPLLQAILIGIILVIVGLTMAYGIGSCFVYEDKGEDYRDT
jgi:hypothetical protein